MSDLPQTSTDGPIGSPSTTSIPLIPTNPSHKKVIVPVVSVSLFILFIIVALLIIFKKKIVLFFRMRNINRTTLPPPPVGAEAPQVAVQIASSNDESEEEEEEEEVVIERAHVAKVFLFFAFLFVCSYFFPS